MPNDGLSVGTLIDLGKLFNKLFWRFMKNEASINRFDGMPFPIYFQHPCLDLAMISKLIFVVEIVFKSHKAGSRIDRIHQRDDLFV